MPGKKTVLRGFFSTRGWQLEFCNQTDAKEFFDDVVKNSRWDEETVKRSIELDGAFVIFIASQMKKEG